LDWFFDKWSAAEITWDDDADDDQRKKEMMCGVRSGVQRE